MKSRGINCGASAGCEAAQEIIDDLKKVQNSNKHYDFVHDEFIDLANNLHDTIPKTKKAKLILMNILRSFIIILFSLLVVLGGYWLLFRIIS